VTRLCCTQEYGNQYVFNITCQALPKPPLIRAAFCCIDCQRSFQLVRAQT
jgi:hypothetical protein